MSDKRYLGSSLYGIFLIFVGIINFVFLVFGKDQLFHNQPLYGRISLFILGAIFLILGISILKLREWARKVLIIFSAFLVIRMFIEFLHLVLMRNISLNYLVIFIIELLLFASPLIYFNRRKVKKQFKNM